jgi:hypothetical protein
VGEPPGRLPQDVEAVIYVGGHLRQGTDDSPSLRPADLERLVQALVDHELERLGEPQRRDRLVGLLISEGGAKEFREPPSLLLGEQVRAGADKDRDADHRLGNRNRPGRSHCPDRGKRLAFSKGRGPVARSPRLARPDRAPRLGADAGSV